MAQRRSMGDLPDYSYDMSSSARGMTDTPGGSAGVGNAMGAVGTGLGRLAQGMASKREAENQWKANQADYEMRNPNAALDAAVQRNYRANLRDNLGSLVGKDYGPAHQGGGAAFFNDLADVYLRSISQGINPLLQQEGRNIAGVPGLNIGGEMIGRDVTPDFKGPGWGESLLGIGGSALGAIF